MLKLTINKINAKACIVYCIAMYGFLLVNVNALTTVNKYNFNA